MIPPSLDAGMTSIGVVANAKILLWLWVMVVVLWFVVCGGDEKCSFPFMTLQYRLCHSLEREILLFSLVNSASAFLPPRRFLPARTCAAFCKLQR